MVGAAGPYGFTGTGTLFLPTGAVQIAAVGRINLHADGTLSGSEARSVGGDFANETLAGTWTVNANCTFKLTAKVFVSGVLVRTSVLVGVLDQNMVFRTVAITCFFRPLISCSEALGGAKAK